MAERVTIEGQTYLERNPLGVLGLSFITIGVYFVYWFYKVNEEIKTYTRDESISPARSTVALFPGGLIIVPAVIALYNTGVHVQKVEERRGLQSIISPALVAVLAVIFAIANGAYVQEHLNRVWDSAAGQSAAAPAPPPPAPAMS